MMAMKFGTNFSEIGNILTFHPAPPAGQILHFITFFYYYLFFEISQYSIMDWKWSFMDLLTSTTSRLTFLSEMIVMKFGPPLNEL